MGCLQDRREGMGEKGCFMKGKYKQIFIYSCFLILLVDTTSTLSHFHIDFHFIIVYNHVIFFWLFIAVPIFLFYSIIVFKFIPILHEIFNLLIKTMELLRYKFLIQCLTREHTVPNKGAYGAKQGNIQHSMLPCSAPGFKPPQKKQKVPVK